MSLPPLHELEPAPRRKGFRIAPRSWPSPADAASPVFQLGAAKLWRAWMEFAADSRAWRCELGTSTTGAASTSSDPPFSDFPIWCAPKSWRSEPIAPAILDSRARFGWWDLGVNRRRLLRWVHDLQQITEREREDR